MHFVLYLPFNAPQTGQVTTPGCTPFPFLSEVPCASTGFILLSEGVLVTFVVSFCVFPTAALADSALASTDLSSALLNAAICLDSSS